MPAVLKSVSKAVIAPLDPSGFLFARQGRILPLIPLSANHHPTHRFPRAHQSRRLQPRSLIAAFASNAACSFLHLPRPPPANSPPDQPPANTPLPASSCQDGLEFVADLTVPDGSLLGRGAQVDKRWQVQNTGTCNWDERYRLVLVRVPIWDFPMSRPSIRRAAAQPRSSACCSPPRSSRVFIPAPGRRSHPSGDLFGEVIYVEFQVN